MIEEYQPRYEKSYALIIGIDTYSDPRFSPLGEAEADAKAMAALLGAPPFDFEVVVLLGDQATRRAILKALFALRSTQPDDRILVYFAGHGYTLIDRFGAETGYLAAVDTIPDQDFTALELDEVSSALCRYAPAKHIGFIFDACYSGQALGLTRAVSLSTGKLLSRRAYQVLSAGAGDQTVSDYYSMTDLIIEALQSDLSEIDGVFTFNDLGLLVQQQMSADSGHQQLPQFGHLRGSQGGDQVFLVTDEAALGDEIVRPSAVAPPTGTATGAAGQAALPTSFPIPARLGAVAAVIVALILAGILLLGGGSGGPSPTPTPSPVGPTSTPTLSDKDREEIKDATIAFEREMRFALETLTTSRLPRYAAGEALEGRLNAVEVLKNATIGGGDCRWDYTYRGMEFVELTVVSPREVVVEAIVDRDGTVWCAEGELAEYGFRGPNSALFTVEKIDGKWIVSDWETIN